MALLRASGNFQLAVGSTATITPTVSDPDSGTFQAKVLIFRLTSNTALDADAASIILSEGAYDGTRQFAVSTAMGDNTSPSRSGRCYHNDRCLVSLSTDGTSITGHLTVTAWDATSFTVTPTDAFPFAFRVEWEALGGSEYTGEVGTYQQTSGAGNQTVSLVNGALTPKAVELIGAALTALGTPSTRAKFSHGWMTVSAQGCIGGGAGDNVNPTSTVGITQTDHCLALPNNAGTGFAQQLSYVSFAAGSFTVNKDVGGGTPYIGYIVHGGTVQAAAVTEPSIVGTGTHANTAVGFTPRILKFLQSGTPTATQSAFVAEWQLCVGWAIGAGGHAIYATSANGLATSDAMMRISSTVPIQKWTRTGVSVWADGGTADIDSRDAQGFTWDQLITDTQATLNLVLALGDAVVLPAIHLDPTTLNFSAVSTGADPADQTVAITNSGAGALDDLAVGTISYGAGWASGVSATLSGDIVAPSTLTVSVVTGALAAGTYTATVPVTSATASNSPQNVSVSFVVTAAPTKLAMITQPSGAFVGVAFATQPVVELRDAGSNPVLLAGRTITAAIGGTGAGTLSGTLTAVTGSNGRATFTNLTLNAIDTFTLMLTSAALTQIESASFAVAAGGSSGSPFEDSLIR